MTYTFRAGRSEHAGSGLGCVALYDGDRFLAGFDRIDTHSVVALARRAHAYEGRAEPIIVEVSETMTPEEAAELLAALGVAVVLEPSGMPAGERAGTEDR